MKLTSKEGSSRKKILCALGLCLAISLAGLAACAPQQTGKAASGEVPASTKAEADAPSAADSAEQPASVAESMGYADFIDRDSGVYPDIESGWRSAWMNAGNRGCNACHENLYDVIKDLNPEVHLASSVPGYGKNATWRDCYQCHQSGANHSGLIVDDLIHTKHLSSQMFVEDLHGNCFSCHAMAKGGTLTMWEFLSVSNQFGGFSNAGSETMQNWAAERKWTDDSVDTVAGISIDNGMDITVTSFDQDPSAKEDRYCASNFGHRYIDAKDWTLKVTGVANEREFTLEELYELPMTERTYVAACGANAVGSYQIANVPAKGILIEDLIEACGGLVDGATSIDVQCYDNWNCFGGNKDLDYCLREGAMLVLEEWGEPLPPEQGYPAMWVVPGSPAFDWNKWVTEINFEDAPAVYSNFHEFMGVASPNASHYFDKPTDWVGTKVGSGAGVNSFWMSPVNDGDVLKMENGKVTLEGIAYNWANEGAKLQQIAFSSDYGNTWTQIDVPQDVDPYAWVHFTAEWEPETPGTYVLYMSGIDDMFGWQPMPTPITVVVE